MSSHEEAPPESFEAALEQLEMLTAALEDPSTGLEASIDLYEKGTELAKRCMDQLRKAELRVETLQASLIDPGDGDATEPPAHEPPDTLFSDLK